jgi:hypothetical protein
LGRTLSPAKDSIKRTYGEQTFALFGGDDPKAALLPSFDSSSVQHIRPQVEPGVNLLLTNDLLVFPIDAHEVP